jgi:type I restriction-modification system DNA methylase subunit
MLKNKLYSCGICKTKPDQISHHKSHILTEKHKDKKELFELKLSKLTKEALVEQHKSDNINAIVNATETIVYKPVKKLNDIDNNDINDIDINIIKDMEAHSIISNKEALKDKIHEIHNYLRNNGAGYGMNALKVFNLLYGLKKIEENNLFDKIKLKRPECEFSYLLQMANEGDDEKLFETIYGPVLDSINDGDINTKNLLFYEIPRKIKSSVFSYLVKEINKITQIEKKCNVLLSGKIYEYFIGRDESAISELGAYFTDRHIVDFIYNKIKPELNQDNTVKSMIDMFGGSGGFTTGYIDYLIKSYPNKIDWSTEIKKIHHYDINADVIKSAGLEFFCLTGQIPNMKENLCYKNSFTDAFNDEKYDLVITNPPYGGDKVKQSDSQLKRKKVADYIKEELKTLEDQEKIKHRNAQLKAIDNMDKQEKKDSDKTKVNIQSCSNRIRDYATLNKLSGNDKESASLILMMEILKEGGTCVGVLKEGVFFNKTYRELRKCLINNFNVREVISVPQDQFENTSTKTSIVIFDNTEQKTTTVKFSELIVERYDIDEFEEVNNNIVISQNKGDIMKIGDKLISVASLDDLNKNPMYSLNGKDYNKKVIVCGKDYELKKINDLCNCLTTTKHCTNIGTPQGKYRLYCSSQDKKLYVNFCEVNEYSIILGQGGNFNIHFDKNFTPSKHVCVIQSKEKNIELLKYCYYIIPQLQKSFITNGSTISWLNKTNIKDFDIPIPKSQPKITEWVNKISKPYDEKNTKQLRIQELETIVQDKIKHIMENEECDDIELKDICKLKDGYEFHRKDMDDRQVFIKNENLPLLKIGSEINDYVIINNKYKNFMVIKNDIVISTLGACGKIRKVIVDEGYYKHGLLKIMNCIINKEYLYYYLICILDNVLIKKLTNASLIGTMKRENLLKLKLKIPKNKKLIEKLEPLFQEIEQLQNDVKQAESLYNQYIKELGEEAIPTIPNSTQVINQTKPTLDISEQISTALKTIKSFNQKNKIVKKEFEDLKQTHNKIISAYK